MLGRIKNIIKAKILRTRFLSNNAGVRTDKSLRLRLPQYIRCGENVIIGEESRLLCWDESNGVLHDKKPEIYIGSNFHATRYFTIQCANKVVIGNNVLIASNVTIIDYNHGMSPETESYLENPLEISKGIYIEDGVWIGNNVLIMPGVTVGKKAIIGAGAVVTHDIPAYSIAVGNPARVIKKYDSSQKAWIKVNVN